MSISSPPPSPPSTYEEQSPVTPSSSLDKPHVAERVAFIPSPPTRAHNNLKTFGRSSWLEKIVLWYNDNTGLLLVILSQLFGSCMNVSVKILNGLDPPIPPFELVAVRMLFTYVFSIGYMYHQKVPHPLMGPPGVRLLLITRGVSGFFGLFGMYFSLQYLTLSDAVVLTFLIPTTTAISGYFLLGEGFSRKQALAGVLSLFGVVLIARPRFLFGSGVHPSLEIDSAHGGVDGAGTVAAMGSIGPAERGTPAQRLAAVAVSLLGVLGATGAVTSLRAIGTRAHTLHAMTYFSLYSIIVSFLGMIIFRVKVVVPMQWQWGALFVFLGVCGYGAQVTLTMGLQRETASRAMLAMYTQIVFAAALERVFFRVYPSYLSLLGTIIILSCAIYVAVSKKTESKETKLRHGVYAYDLEAHLDGDVDSDLDSDLDGEGSALAMHMEPLTVEK